MLEIVQPYVWQPMLGNPRLEETRRSLRMERTACGVPVARFLITPEPADREDQFRMIQETLDNGEPVDRSRDDDRGGHTSTTQSAETTNTACVCPWTIRGE
ncbi:hypothetical protein GCM10009555_029710 [Acrocarpospora macrocephala]|uniref:Uncharacterized protein n=1 Tax=Acrocarpospora macrocephala TaxID=150177 RepID=A0A5M3WSH7_9ACTN|nr:hypothetical protein Amac_047190 [Acrocarpospora macrocephala]